MFSGQIKYDTEELVVNKSSLSYNCRLSHEYHGILSSLKMRVMDKKKKLRRKVRMVTSRKLMTSW